MEIVEILKSKDSKTTKYLQKTPDNHIIETSYFNLEEEVVCISTQIGCVMGCIFCATTKPVDEASINKSFIRNLTALEIIQETSNILLQHRPLKNNKPTLLSYMGMGEPFLNYKNVVQSIRELTKKFPEVHQVTIATTGIVSEKIKSLAKEEFDVRVKVHLSLHAPNNQLRRELMPQSGDIQDALEAVLFFAKNKKEPLKINYILLDGINDSQKNAEELISLIKPHKKHFVVKLMVLNEVVGNLKKSRRFNEFREILREAGLSVVEFSGDGLDVNAGCGMMRRHYYGQK